MTSIDLSVLRKLINLYKSEVAKTVKQLRTDLCCDDLLRGWREQQFPQEGQFGEGGKKLYSFHGIGCSVEDEQVVIDFDFGENGCVDGFDAWRLHLFAENFRDEYPGFENSEAIETGLETLVNSGELVRPGTPPNRSFVYTTELFPALAE